MLLLRTLDSRCCCLLAVGGSFVVLCVFDDVLAGLRSGLNSSVYRRATFVGRDA
jgi:hypothetical protein